jgi:hypothetical protein
MLRFLPFLRRCTTASDVVYSNCSDPSISSFMSHAAEEEGQEGLGEEEGESDGGESDWSECDEEGEEEEPAANAAAAAVGLRPSRRAATDARNMMAAVKYA